MSLHEQEEDARPSDDEPIGEVLARLVGAGRTYAQAEIRRQTVRAREIGLELCIIALLAVIAVMLLFAAVIALVVGAVLALTPLLGAWGATAATVAGAVLLAFLLMLAARGRFRRLGGGEEE